MKPPPPPPRRGRGRGRGSTSSSSPGGGGRGRGRGRGRGAYNHQQSSSLPPISSGPGLVPPVAEHSLSLPPGDLSGAPVDPAAAPLGAMPPAGDGASNDSEVQNQPPQAADTFQVRQMNEDLPSIFCMYYPLAFQIGDVTVSSHLEDNLLNARKLELLNDPEVLALLRAMSSPSSAAAGSSSSSGQQSGSGGGTHRKGGPTKNSQKK